MTTYHAATRKVQRRISLQTPKRDAIQRIPEHIISSIVDHQFLLFQQKRASLESAYSLDPPEFAWPKLMNDWIYIASNYCYILFENDLDCCDELALEIFTAFYLILKLVFRKNEKEHSDITNSDQQNIDILLDKYDDFLSSSRRHYYRRVIEFVHRLSSPSEKSDAARTSRILNIDIPTSTVLKRSLDPKSSLQSPSEFYPQSELNDVSSNNSDSSSSLDLINTSNLKTLDLQTFASLDPDSLVVINIQPKNLYSTSRTVLSINPSYVGDPSYIEANVLPYLKPEDTVVIFSNSELLSDLETTLNDQLAKHSLTNNYWLQGGYKTFKENFIKANNNNYVSNSGSNSTTATKKTGYNLTAYSKYSDNSKYDDPRIPPIPADSSELYNGRIPNVSTSSLDMYNGKIPNVNTSSSDLYNDRNVRLNGHPNGTSHIGAYSTPISRQRNASPPPPPIPTAKPLLKSAIQNNTSNNNSNSSGSNSNSSNKTLFNNSNNLKIPSLSLSGNNSPQFPNTLYDATETSMKNMALANSSNRPTQPSLTPQSFVYKPLSKLKYKPVVGLKNMGSTCYINSMIQCLFSLKEFREFFIDDESLKIYLSQLSSKNVKLTSGFHELFNTFYALSPNNSLPPVIDMTRFLSIINKLNPSYNIPNEQQDTSQFLYYIIDELHKELKISFENAQHLGFIKISNQYGEKYTDWQLKSLKKEGFSYIQNIFNIKEGVVMKCNRCGYSSVRYDTSIMIHLSLKSTNSSLDEILHQNFFPEEMSTRLGNAWDCDGCTKAEKRLEELQEKLEKEHDMSASASKQKEKMEKEKGKGKEKEKENSRNLKKRFFKNITNHIGSKDSDNESSSHRRDRASTPDSLYSTSLTEKEKQEYNRLADIFTRERVAYRSVELVDLPDVLVLCLSLFNPSQQDTKVNLKNLPLQETLDMHFESCSRTYKLNSWIEHLGPSIDSGHYTATVSSPQSWIICDDDKIMTSDRNGQSRDASVYLLFYEAIQD